jgi:hypothetical protein
MMEHQATDIVHMVLNVQVLDRMGGQQMKKKS